jgi:trehalose synthase
MFPAWLRCRHTGVCTYEFGSIVSKVLWKERPVVTAKATGIPMQFPEPFHKNLVESVEGYAARVLDLLTRPGERGKFDRPGRGYVGKHFLLLRVLRDELRLIKQVVQTA